MRLLEQLELRLTLLGLGIVALALLAALIEARETLREAAAALCLARELAARAVELEARRRHTAAPAAVGTTCSEGSEASA